MPPSVVAGIELPLGDPGAIESAASSFSKASNDFASTGQTAQNAVSSVGSWQGLASINFRDRCGNYASAAAAGESACDQAARALHRYSKELEHAQNQVRDLQRQAQDCVNRINAAKARAATAAGRQNAAAQRMERGGTAAAADGGAAMAAAAREYQDAGGDLRQAQGDENAASGELTQLQKRASDINERIKAQGKATAGAVSSAAGGLPRVDFPGAGAPGAPAGGGGFPWGDLALVFGAVTKGTSMYGVYKALPFIATAKDWQNVAPSAAGEYTLTDLAQLLRDEKFPTFNNGKVGSGLGALLRRAPGSAGEFGDFMGDASRATPFFTKFGVVTGAAGVAWGGYSIYSDVKNHKGGDQLAVDVTSTAFSGSTVAFLVAPNPVTGGAVIVTGIAWGGAEAWQHRAAIAHGVEAGGKFIGNVAVDAGKTVWDTSPPGILYNNRHAIGHVLDSGANIARDGVNDLGDGISSAWSWATG